MSNLMERLSAFDDPFDNPIEKDMYNELQVAIKNGKAKNYSVKKINSDMDVYIIKPHSATVIHQVKKLITKANMVSGYLYDNIKVSADFLSEDKPRLFVYKNTRCELVVTDETVFLNDSNSSTLNAGIKYDAQSFFLDGESPIIQLKILFVLDDAYKLFDAYDTIPQKHSAIEEYGNLTSPQRAFLRSQFNRPIKTGFKDDSLYTPIKNEKALRVLYETCKDTYDEKTRMKAKLILNELRGSLNYGDRVDLVNQLSHILCIDTQAYPYKNKTFDEIISLFDKHMYGLYEFKERFAEFLLAAQYSKSTSFAVLLVGPPGVGKTSIGTVTAQCCEKPFVHIDCSGADVIAMSGLVKSYGGAKAGKVFDSLWEIGRADAVVMFDEIDKLSITKEGNPYSVFLKALGPQKLLHDEYVDSDIDVSSTIFIATANNINDIPGYIINRFGDNIFYLDKYSCEEKVAITENYVVKASLEEHNINQSELLFSKEALLLLANEYCEDEGMREMTGYITSLIRKVIRLWVCNCITKPFTVDESFVRENLVKKTDRKKQKLKLGF